MMGARLQRNPSPFLVARDASLEAWAIVVRKAGQFGNAFPEDTRLCSSEITRGLMRARPWRPVRRRQFRTRLTTILPGELTAFRQGAAISATQIENLNIVNEVVVARVVASFYGGLFVVLKK